MQVMLQPRRIEEENYGFNKVRILTWIRRVINALSGHLQHNRHGGNEMNPLIFLTLHLSKMISPPGFRITLAFLSMFPPAGSCLLQH